MPEGGRSEAREQPWGSCGVLLLLVRRVGAGGCGTADVCVEWPERRGVPLAEDAGMSG